MDDALQRIEELEQQINALPAGSIGKKNVKGHIYYYHRWTENGKRREKYIPENEVESFRRSIELRRKLIEEVKAVSAVSERRAYDAGTGEDNLYGPSFAGEGSLAGMYGGYRCNVITGDALRQYTAPVSSLKKRSLFGTLEDYLYRDESERVMILYGLRRTGKTTMIRQAVSDMKPAVFDRTAFIHIGHSDTMADLNRDMRRLLDRGYRYVFIDEVTFIEDFIEGAALFSDIFSASGMKIVLSGTDSLGFLFAQEEQLYDRCRFIHTTFIPYREFDEVLGITGIDEYIRYGGTMSISGINYNRESTFASKASADEYVDSSIARNIQHSLLLYQHGGHFRALQDLYDRGELTGAINRVVEDINHRFTIDVLTRHFRSHDLGGSASNLRRDRNEPSDILDSVNAEEISRKMASVLEIREKEDQTVTIQDIHAREIREYLVFLDLTQDIPVVDIDDLSAGHFRTVFTQPGLRYSQADALISGLAADPAFAEYSARERSSAVSRIRSEIMGRMMEEIILLETAKAYPGRDVFTLQFSIGEFDMVIADPETLTCEIYEIKHSTERDDAQMRHLTDEAKCAKTEFRYGTITGKYVLYRGEDAEVDGVHYRNAESYLKELYLHR